MYRLMHMTLFNVFQRYDIRIHVPKGFKGRASIIIGFGTQQRHEDGFTLPYVQWDLKGDAMTLNTNDVKSPRTDIWHQKLSSDQGK